MKSIWAAYESVYNWVEEHWAKYQLIKNLYLFSAISISIGLLYLNETIVALTYFGIFWFIFVTCLFVDGKRVLVAENDPESFISGEKIELFFKRMNMGILVTSMFSLYGLIFLGAYINFFAKVTNFQFPDSVVLFVAGCIVFAFVTSPPIILNIIEDPSTNKIGKKLFPNLVPQYYPSEEVRARTRFIVALQLIDDTRKNKMKDFSLFKEGINIYDDYLKRKVHVELCDPERFFNYANFKIFFTQDKLPVKKCLEGLIALTYINNSKPSDFLIKLKEMLEEPTSDKDLIKDVEVDIKPIKHILSKRNEYLALWFAPLVVNIIGSIILHFAFNVG